MVVKNTDTGCMINDLTDGGRIDWWDEWLFWEKKKLNEWSAETYFINDNYWSMGE